jgi:hypothetical protein
LHAHANASHPVLALLLVS